MEALNRLSAMQRNLLIVALPTLGMIIFMMSGWQYVKAGLLADGAGTASVLFLPLLLVAAGWVIAWLSGAASSDKDSERLERALETCKANVMVADNDFNIKYMNKSVLEMMRDNEVRLRDALPGFSADQLIGMNVDVFHKNPSHQRRMVQNLSRVYETDIEVAGLTFGLVATPIFSRTGDRLGTVVEWYDKTEELAREEERESRAAENQRIAEALKICDTSVMIADSEMNIIFMNDAVKEMMEDAEAELRKELPSFSADKIMGSNADVFHKDPSHQRNMIARLKEVYRTRITVGSLTFSLIATPLKNEEGERIGTVIEWENLTEQLEREKEAEQIAAENLRVRQALDNVSTNTMIADADGQIVYLNQSVTSMLKNAESDIRKELSGFDASNLLGRNFDTFHKNPAHQRNLLGKLTSTYSTQIQVGGRTFKLVANPIIDDNRQRIGSVVEWDDRTEEVRTENEVSELVDAAVEGDLTYRLPLEGKTGFHLTLGQGLNRLVSNVEDVIKDVVRVLDALANGDLTQKIDREYQGSYQKLKEDANKTIAKLIDIIGNVVSSANAVTNGADEIAQGNADLSQRTEEQASSLEETASSMEEMTSAVRQSSDNALKASERAEQALKQASRGGEVVANAVNAMSQINDSSKRIADIIGVIDEIAFQTNLLALNAAVEAARAGEQGRGFAVVAGEVRNLAQRSAQAAKEIKDLIRDSVAKVEDGTDLVNESGAMLQEIVEAVQNVTSMIRDIAQSSQEQSSGIEQVNTAVTQMDEMTQQNAALVEEASAAGESLSEQARQLMNLMSFFTVDEAALVNAQYGEPIVSPVHSASRTASSSTRSRKAVPPAAMKPVIDDGDEWDEF